MCKTPLGSKEKDWRLVTKKITTPLAKMFQESDTEIRERVTEPVMLHSHFCPQCGGCLTTEIKVTGREISLPVD